MYSACTNYVDLLDAYMRPMAKPWASFGLCYGNGLGVQDIAKINRGCPIRYRHHLRILDKEALQRWSLIQ